MACTPIASFTWSPGDMWLFVTCNILAAVGPLLSDADAADSAAWLLHSYFLVQYVHRKKKKKNFTSFGQPTRH